MRLDRPISRRVVLAGALCSAALAQAEAAESALLTFVGTGKQGFAGDGGPATAALLDQPFHCSQDRKGNLYLADTFNHRIRKISIRDSKISTVAGSGKKGYSGDRGAATSAALNEPYGVLPDRDGNLFIVDRLNAVIRRVDADTGLISTYAGTGQEGYFGDGGPADRAMLREPNAVDFDPKGNLYIADVADNRIRRVDVRTRAITTVCGTGRREFAGDGGPAIEASIMGARGVAFDRDGTMYVCEREGNRLRAVDARTGVIRTVAGTGARGYSGDGGPALEATFDGPKWVHVGPDGMVYIVDTENHCVRRYDPRARTITTVAGGRKGSGGDAGPATDAQMDRPHGCWVDRAGRLYTADTNNHRIRMNPLTLSER